MKKLLFLYGVMGLMMLFQSCDDSHSIDNNRINFITQLSANQATTNDSLQVEITLWYNNYAKSVAFTWDDNVPWHKYVAEMFDKHGLQTTFYINTGLFYRWQDFVKHPLNYHRYKRIAKKGHEIGTHTDKNCNYMLLTIKEAEHQMVLSSERVHEMYGYWPATMSHPTSHYDETIDSLMALHYIDSRYSVRKDNDSSYSFLRIRTSYPFAHYKASIDSFAISSSNSYVYGGHSMDGKGYEPIPSQTLDSLLTYIQLKYDNMFWITSFDNLAMYEYIRSNIHFSIDGNNVLFDLGNVRETINHYTHPQAILTLKFIGGNYDFISNGLVKYWYDGDDSYVSVDLRKTDRIYFKQSIIQ